MPSKISVPDPIRVRGPEPEITPLRVRDPPMGLNAPPLAVSVILCGVLTDPEDFKTPPLIETIEEGSPKLVEEEILTVPPLTIALPV